MPDKRSQTILFADVCRSTALFETLGDERARSLIAHCLNAMSDVVKHYGGVVVKTIGDEIMATLPTDRAGVHAGTDIQQRISRDPGFIRDGVKVRVGLHFGDTLVEDGDVFGDAVNTAARMAQLAKAEQIVTTQSTAKTVEDIEFRSLGKVRVKGKLMPLEVVDVVWQEDTSNVTSISRAVQIEAPTGGASLTVSCNGLERTMKEISPPMTVGRDPANDVSVDGQWVSRNHAMIEYRKGNFVLSDRSTNGTFLQQGDDEFRLHRDEAIIRRDGQISLGQSVKVAPKEPILQYKVND